MPKISVIVPVYKAEAYLHRCVDSLLTQTFQDFEILLVDDGSPDRSGEICDEYARQDSRVRVFHKENGGVSSARNEGINNARSKWITFIDSDDYVSPTYLDDFGLEVLDAEIYLLGYSVEQKGEIIAQHAFSTDSPTLYSKERLFIEGEERNILNSPVCKLFDAGIIKRYNLQFDVKISYGEDHLFVLTYLLYCHRAAVSHSVSYFYVLGDEVSLTRRVLPYNELIYYIIEARKLQNRLLSEDFLRTQAVKAVVNRRVYWSFVLAIKSFFQHQASLDEYKKIRQKISVVDFGYESLGLKQKFLVLLFRTMPAYCSYFLFKLLI